MNIPALYDALLDKLAANSLQELVTCASEFLHQHVTVLDIGYKVLAIHPKEKIGDPYWDAQIIHGYVPEANLDRIFQYKYPNATFHGVSYVDWGDVVCRRCVCTITHKKTVLGHLSVYHTDPAISVEELKEVTRCLTNVIRIYLVNNSQVSSVREYMLSALVGQLFSGRQLGQEFYDNWMKSTNYELKGNYFIASVNCPEEDAALADIICMRLSGMHKCTVYTELEGKRFILFYNVPNEKMMLGLLDEMQNWIRNKKLRIGISQIFAQIESLRNALFQAKHALSYGSLYMPEESLYHYPRLRTEIILSCVCDNMEKENYMHPLLSRILSDDQENKTQYCQTLTTYLNCMCDSNAAAQQLFIHRNTLLYRIKHIEETYDISLRDYPLVQELLLSHWLEVHDTLKQNCKISQGAQN